MKLKYILSGTVLAVGAALPGTSATANAENPDNGYDLNDLLPNYENYQWAYSGFVEYGHEMTLSTIAEENGVTDYNIEGYVYDPSGGDAEGDYSLNITYTVTDDTITQYKDEEMMLDSEFDEIELIQAPLEEGNSWTQTVAGTTLESEIINVHSENGNDVFTVRYEDPESDYYEERQIQEGTGVTEFEKLRTDEDGDSYEVTYSLNESGYETFDEPLFTDVSASHWYWDYLAPLASRGIVDGYPDGTFQFNADITVAEYLSMSLHTMGYHVADGDDVWYDPHVDRAIEEGLIEEGYFDDYNRAITREEMVRVAVTALGEQPADNGDATNFNDQGEISAENEGYVAAAVNMGIIEGYPDNTFRPDDTATRAESAKMFYYTLEQMDGDDNGDAAFTESEAVQLEREYENRLIQETDDNNYAVNFDSKQALINHTSEIIDYTHAHVRVHQLYEERDAGLYLIPQDAPLFLNENEPYEFTQESEGHYKVIQSAETEMHGAYTLNIHYEQDDNGNWIISNRYIQ